MATSRGCARTVVAETGRGVVVASVHRRFVSNRGLQSPGGAICLGDYKLLEYYENGTIQLFNLREDIGETNDLSQTDANKVAEKSTDAARLAHASVGPDDGS